MRLASLTAFVALAAAAACTKDNPDYCGSNPCPIDAPLPIDGASGCTANPGICTADQSCLDDQCVDCVTNNNHQQADCTRPAAPVCAADHSCRACAADSECDSNWCEAGTCIASSDVIYVATNGTASSGCNQGAACSTMAQGIAELTASRKYISVAPGTYSSSAAITINGTAVIRAEGVTLERSNNNQILEVQGGDVTVIGATVHNAAGMGEADGIKCLNGARLTLRHVIVDNNADRGIEAPDCDLIIARAIISNNRKGGVRLEAGRITAANMFVFFNGDNAGSVGGMTVAPTLAGSRIEFSTFRKNNAQTGSIGALQCAGQQITARNNIIYGSANTDVEVSGAACIHSYSVIGPMNTPTGTEVRSLPIADIGFVNANGTTAADYHITGTSMVRGTAAENSTMGDTAVDYDGDARPAPAGGRADLGADEVP